MQPFWKSSRSTASVYAAQVTWQVDAERGVRGKIRQGRPRCSFSYGAPINGTLPETNISPKNGWLEYYFPIGFRPIFRCYVSERKCNIFSQGKILESGPLLVMGPL